MDRGSWLEVGLEVHPHRGRKGALYGSAARETTPPFLTELEAGRNAGLVKKCGAPWEKNLAFRFATHIVQRSTGRTNKSGITNTNSSPGEGTIDGDKKSWEGASATNETEPDQDAMIHRLGSKSSSSYDRLSVALRIRLSSSPVAGLEKSTPARALSPPGDWEELWGWNGALAYEGSRLKYNTTIRIWTRVRCWDRFCSGHL